MKTGKTIIPPQTAEVTDVAQFPVVQKMLPATLFATNLGSGESAAILTSSDGGVTFEAASQDGSAMVLSNTANAISIQSPVLLGVTKTATALLSGVTILTTDAFSARGGFGGGDDFPLVDLPSTPTARWNADHSTVVESSGRVVSATDIQELADATEGGSGNGPLAMTDATGRKFWRFEEAEFLDVAGDLVCTTRDVSVFAVIRVPRPHSSSNNIFSLGSRAQGTGANTQGAALVSRKLGKSVGHVMAFGKGAYSAASGAEWLVPGAQMQVMGMASSVDDMQLFLNERLVDVTKPFNVAGVVGAEIGGYTQSATQFGIFDLYEMVVYSPGLSHAEALAVSEALMVGYSIAEVENQLILDGDSITQGTGDVIPALSCAAVMTNPGESLIPANWRVVNVGISGNDVADLVTRRDSTDSWATQFLTGGQNVVAFEIGRNDWPTTAASVVLADIVDYLNTTTTGVLQRGWTVRVIANIAAAASLQAKVVEQRAGFRDNQFLLDTLSGTGQTFDGKVTIISTDLIEDGSQTIFSTSTDASDTTYYAGDNTHPNILGAELRVNGGDDPALGIAFGLT